MQKIAASMQKYLKPDKKLTFYRVDKKGSDVVWEDLLPTKKRGNGAKERYEDMTKPYHSDMKKVPTHFEL